jgi:hypothetical protein
VTKLCGACAFLLLAGCSGQSKKAIGDVCAKDSDCESGRCDEAVCKAANPYGIGELCKSDYECRSNRCLNGACAQGTGKAGQACRYWEQCESGQCTKGVCVDATLDGGIADRGPREAGARESGFLDRKRDTKLAPDAAQLDMCEQMAAKEKLTCKPLADQTVTTAINWTPGCYAYGKLVIDSAGTFKLQTDAVGKLPTTIIAKQLEIQQGGILHSDYSGYPANAGPGRGENSAGAGHGGEGQAWGSQPGGGTYGVKEYPVLAGSGAGGAGGGALRICVAGKATIEGSIRVRGQDGQGAGSGGSILIIADEIAGKGTLDASGGNGAYVICGASGGSGGGGRIALLANTQSFTGTTNVNGQSTCGGSSQPGTVYKGGLPPP